MSKQRQKIAVLLLDESASMELVIDDVLGSFRNFVTEMGKIKGMRMTLTTFNGNGCEPGYVALPISDVPALDYRPSASTPLFDAVGKTIRATEDWLSKHGSGKDQVFFAIQTDGQENFSREYSQEAVKRLIEERRAKGWEFQFPGADLATLRQGRSLGIPDSAVHDSAAVIGPGASMTATDYFNSGAECDGQNR